MSHQLQNQIEAKMVTKRLDYGKIKIRSLRSATSSLLQQVVETLLSEKPVFFRLPSNELKKLSALGEERNRETLHYLQAHK